MTYPFFRTFYSCTQSEIFIIQFSRRYWNWLCSLYSKCGRYFTSDWDLQWQENDRTWIEMRRSKIWSGKMATSFKYESQPCILCVHYVVLLYLRFISKQDHLKTGDCISKQDPALMHLHSNSVTSLPPNVPVLSNRVAALKILQC